MLSKITVITFQLIPDQRYGVAKHLFWLAKGKPGGHQKWNFIENTTMNWQYKEVLVDLNLNVTLLYEITVTKLFDNHTLSTCVVLKNLS